jgi:iron(III) transport system permease protein
MVAALLIFVESMKELPAALLLQPFDFQTLPTYVYQYASDEQLELAALGAILIVLVGLIPLLILNRSIDSNSIDSSSIDSSKVIQNRVDGK